MARPLNQYKLQRSDARRRNSVGYNHEEEGSDIWQDARGSASQDTDAGLGMVEGSRQPGRPHEGGLMIYWSGGPRRQGRRSDDRRQRQVEKIRG